MDLITTFEQQFKAAFGVLPLLTSNYRTIPGSQYLPIIAEVGTYADPPSVFEETEFTIGQQTLNFSGGKLTKSGSLGNVFAPPIIWVARKMKNVIITNVDGGINNDGNTTQVNKGTEVVERWGDSEWDISIQGLLIDMDQHIFPISKLETLRKFFEIPSPVEVAGQIWDVMGINSIWFSEFSPVPVPGFQDTVSFTLQARSIRPVEFYLNGEDAS